VSNELILLLLRIVSGLLLLTILFAIFRILWRDFQQTTRAMDRQKRSYGSLIVMQEIDGAYLLTGEVYPLLPITSLGRSPTNTIPINDTFASSEHALITLRERQWWLEDRNSRNGTLLNGRQVTQPVVITHDDIIGIGHISLRINLND